MAGVFPGLTPNKGPVNPGFFPEFSRRGKFGGPPGWNSRAPSGFPTFVGVGLIFPACLRVGPKGGPNPVYPGPIGPPLFPSSPNPEGPFGISFWPKDPGKVRGQRLCLVITGVEIGGGSIRIHNRDFQKRMFGIPWFQRRRSPGSIWFLNDAFESVLLLTGVLPLVLARLAAMFAGQDSIRGFIAFPKTMPDAM